MARVTLNQTNFTAGEVSPKVYGRTDISRYQNGARELTNCIINLHGGAERRHGSQFIASTKNHAKRSRLVPFVFSTTQSYMLEFGDQYLRVYVASGGQVVTGGATPYEIATPYTEAMLSDMDYVQGADTMFIFHKDVLINTLRRLAADNWVIGTAPLTTLPFAENGHRFNTTLTLSDLTVGTGRTLTAGSGVFLAADVGRRITHLAGTATITAVVSATQVTADISAAFGATVIAANEWILEDSPQSALKPSANDPVGTVITLTCASSSTTTYGPSKVITGISHDGASTVTVNCVAHGMTTGDTVQITDTEPVAYRGTYVVTVTGVDTFTYTLSPSPGSATTTGNAREIIVTTVTVAGWRAEDVGKFVDINGGLVRITTFTSSSVVSGELLIELTSDIAAPANAWVLMGSEWNAYDGYPRTGTFYEQRLIAAGSITKPQKVWGSRSGLYFDFTQGVNDDDGFGFSLPSTGQINPILRITTARALLPLTYGGEYTMSGGVEKPLTPTNVQMKDQSVYGCNSVKPCRVGSEVLFVQRSGRKIRALSYKFDTDSYTAPDLTVLAEHITAPGIVDMCYQQEPRPLLWCVRTDGKLAVLTIDREEGVTAWTPQETDGVVESIATIPNPTGDEVWMIVRRTINGATKRYVERFEDGYYTDCAVKGTDGAGKAVWTGLGHLEGKTVAVRADGIHIGSFTVTGGAITLPRNAQAVEIGLNFTNTVTLLRPEVQAGDATAQGNAQRVHEVSLLFSETVGAKINGNEISFRQFGSELLDVAPQAYSGFKSTGLSDWTRGDQTITITQDEPNPFHLLAVIRKFTVNS